MTRRQRKLASSSGDLLHPGASGPGAESSPRVTERDIMISARKALHLLDDERALRSNPLLAHLDVRLSHDRLRAHVLRALESLDPGSRADVASERRGRLYTILLQCDVQRIPHERTAATLGLSRRQFYRDRRAALVAFAAALREVRATAVPATTEPRDVRLLYIKTLREQGKYDLVWRESVRALAAMRGDPREAEVWTVASEAARFFGNARKSQEAIDALRAINERPEHPHLRRATALRTAICEASLDWMQADLSAARARVERVVCEGGDERTMYGRDVTLFGILLNLGARMALDAGDWSAAAEYTRRGERIAARSEVQHVSSFHHRLRASLALQRDGDLSRATTELHDALDIADAHNAISPIAISSVELGVALMTSDPGRAIDYIRFGLAMGRDACGFDDFATLYARTVPALLAQASTASVFEGIESLRARAPLFRRADLMTRLGEASVSLAAADYAVAAATTADLAREFERASMLPAAAEAQVISAEALCRNGRTLAARRALRRAREFISIHGAAPVRRRAAAIDGTLALSG
jgi:hypothetical protein